jgi:hypothetical protein
VHTCEHLYCQRRFRADVLLQRKLALSEGAADNAAISEQGITGTKMRTPSRWTRRHRRSPLSPQR